MVTPEWMSTGLRIARMDKPWAEARQLLEVALRDEIDVEQHPAPRSSCSGQMGEGHEGDP